MVHSKGRMRYWLFAATCGSWSFGALAQPAGPVLPQESPAQSTSAEVDSDDIIVTARRREESLQRVPLSVTAVSGETLRAQQINTALDLGKLAPGMTVTPSFRGANTPYFVIRGQRLIDTSAVVDPVTIVYLNEVPFMRPQGLNGALFDIQNVQVLRGPQGTLFGRNTTGGAVLINTNPATDRFEGYGALTLGTFDRVGIEGAINIPLSDTLAVRVAGVVARRDGYMKDRYTNYDANNEHYDAQRLTLRWKPTDSFTTTFYANRFDTRNHGTSTQLYFLAPPTATTTPVYSVLQNELALNQARPRTYSASQDPRETAHTWDVTNVSTLELSDSLTLKNIISYRKIRTYSRSDIDGTVAVTQNNEGRTSGKQFTEELQLQGTSDNFDWIVGGFYFRERADDVSTSVQRASPTFGNPSGVINVVNRSMSAFVSGTYRFGIEGLSLSAGGRITRDNRRGDGLQARIDLATGAIVQCNFRNASGALIAPPCLTPQKASFTEPSYSVSLNYQASPDLLLYAAHRRGYKSGGIQNRAQSFGALTIVKPEIVNDFELGAKYAFNSGGVRGRFNIAAYYAKYKDLQRGVSFVSPITGGLISGLFNAAASTVKGVEADFLLAHKGLELSGSVGYVDPKYDKFETFSVLGTPTDISDWGFAFVPTWTVNGQIAYTLPIDPKEGEVRLSLAGRYQSKFITVDTPSPSKYLPGFAVFDARVAWSDISGSPFSLAVIATNVFNKTYATYATNVSASLGTSALNPAPPRMVAVEGRVKF